mmetsp:Transcript_48240/g.114948  ORF Transcript_48240/g.114948 Transcript_48240/m.114948 type:complete len:234 (+) Transcript_48240:2009-2710(+)
MQVQHEREHAELLAGTANHLDLCRTENAEKQHPHQLCCSQRKHDLRNLASLETHSRCVHELHDVHHEEGHTQDHRCLAHWVTTTKNNQKRYAEQVVGSDQNVRYPPIMQWAHERAESQHCQQSHGELCCAKRQMSRRRKCRLVEHVLNTCRCSMVDLHQSKAHIQDAAESTYVQARRAPSLRLKLHRIELRLCPAVFDQRIHRDVCKDRTFQQAVHRLAVESGRHHCGHSELR